MNAFIFHNNSNNSCKPAKNLRGKSGLGLENYCYLYDTIKLPNIGLQGGVGYEKIPICFKNYVFKLLSTFVDFTKKHECIKIYVCR